jgi:integrase
MRLWQHKNGIHYILYGPELKRRVSTGTRDRRQAEQYLAQFILGSQTPKVESPTVAYILDHYRDHHGPEVRAVGAMGYGIRALKRHLGTSRPETLMPTDFKSYARSRKREGVGNGTILREMGIMRAAGGHAIAHKLLAAEQWPSRIKSPVKKPKVKEIWLTRPEASKLIAECNHPHLWLFVKLGLMTLARSAAILELPWTAPAGQAQVMLERRLIDYGEGHGNKRRALVPINDELLADLQAARRIARTNHVIEYQGQPVKWIKNAFAGAVGRAGLPDTITPHRLRHTGCTWLVEDGVPYEVIGKMAGDTAETIETTYGHHHPSFLKRAADTLQLENRG